MTPTERAEKIVNIFIGYEKVQDKSFYDHVLIELRAVYMECAGIATEELKDQLWSPNAHRCATRIAALIRSRGEAK